MVCAKIASVVRQIPEPMDPPQQRIVRAKTVLKRWMTEYGAICPGALERNHGPHWVDCQDDLSLDHIIPRANKGKSSWRNLRVLCKAENNAKGAYHPSGGALYRARVTSLYSFWVSGSENELAV